jgi:hypothetical protein
MRRLRRPSYGSWSSCTRRSDVRLCPALTLQEPVAAAESENEADEQEESPPRAVGLSPLMRLAWLALFAGLAILTVSWLTSRGNDVAAWELTVSVPAHRVLTIGDVKPVREPDSDLAMHVVGRMTLIALQEGNPVRKTDLGPDVTARLGTDALAVGVRLRAADVGAALHAGDEVELRLFRDGHSTAPFFGIVMESSAPNEAAVALRRTDAEAYLRRTQGHRPMAVRVALRP